MFCPMYLGWRQIDSCCQLDTTESSRTLTVLHSFEQISHQILQAPLNSALFPLRLHLYWYSSNLPVHNFLNDTDDCSPLLTPELFSRISERGQWKWMAGNEGRKDRRGTPELCGECGHICLSYGLWTFSLGPWLTTEERH